MCGPAEPLCHRPAAGPTGALSPAVYPGHPGLKITRAAQPGRTQAPETLDLRRAPVSPCRLASTSPQGDGPREGVLPVFVPDPCPTTAHPCALDGEQRDAAHTDPALVTGHGGHERPAVRVWVVHLHRAQVGLSVIAPYSVEPPAAGHQGDPAPAREHGHDQAPLVRH